MRGSNNGFRFFLWADSTSICNSVSHRWSSSIGNKRPPTIHSQYKIYNPSCVLSVYPTSPSYKKYKGAHSMFVERQGKIMMEFIPSIPQNKTKASFDPNSKVTVALSVDEIGQFLAKTSSSSKGNASNDNALEFKRLGRQYLKESSGNQASATDVYTAHGIITSSYDHTAEKRLTIKPSQDGSMNFQVHQSYTTLEVSVSSGEMEVLKCLFRDSISHLLGWESMMRINDNNSMNAASNAQTAPQYPNAQTAPQYRIGGPGMEEHLF